MPKQTMRCCCCDGDAGRFEQHWNRDSGYGICARCVAQQCATDTPEEILSRYGQPGIHYEQPSVCKNGRRYKVLATTTSQKRADAFMQRTPGAAVLLVSQDGTIVLVDSRDEGEPLAEPNA